ncbi:SRPBCC family protein [Cellulomonas terrae]|uniref:Uncharacterized protein n=1 Tax=Cellulomonas terrae TaxID=311234 RepID=A0A511JLP7_9CELL|nr:SRPBCC family protein [Cellulomonas terrae]GEL98918.1 hypothetical protein CTE05_24650 [Cellulomonas terrae]
MSDPVGLWWDAGLEWFDRRWAARRAAELRAAVERHARLPVIPLIVQFDARLPHPAAEVWELVAGESHVTCGPDHVLGFTLPSTRGREEEVVRCCVVRAPDGAWTGRLSTQGELVEGWRDVTFALSSAHPSRSTLTLTPDGDDACVLRWDVDTEAHPGTAAREHDGLADEMRRGVARVAAALARDELDESWSVTRPCVADRHVDVEVSVEAVVQATPQAAWAVVADADRFVPVPDDRAASFSVPGSLRGEPGELVGVLLCPGQQGSTVLFWRVVALLPGRAVVWRTLSTDAAHAARREISIEPEGDGVRVCLTVREGTHPSEARSVRRRVRAGGERYLELLRAELADPLRT